MTTPTPPNAHALVLRLNAAMRAPAGDEREAALIRALHACGWRLWAWLKYEQRGLEAVRALEAIQGSKEKNRRITAAINAEP